MSFSSFEDFYNRRDIIRNYFSTLSVCDKGTYKYYVYSRRYLKERLCDMMWMYIAGTEEDVSYCKESLEREHCRYKL